MLIVLAATAPVELDDPMAVTHSPTLRFEALADSIWLTVVLDDVVMVTSVFAGAVVVVVDLLDPGRKVALCSVPLTTKPEDDTEDTWPKAVENWGKVSPGVVVLVGNDPPPGKLPEGGRPEKRKPEPPVPPLPKTLAGLVQVPLELAGMMLTVRAVMGLLDEPGDDGVPLTLTQSPAVTLLSEPVTVWVKVVDDVQLTVVWPVSGFCTSMEEAASAAISPEAPGIGRLAGEPEPELEAGWLVVEAAAPPQAAAASATAPRPTASAGPRRRFAGPVNGWGDRIGSPLSFGFGVIGIRKRSGRALHSSHSLRSASMGASRAARVAG